MRRFFFATLTLLCLVPFHPASGDVIARVVQATHDNGYAVARATGVSSVKVYGERYAGDCSAAMHSAVVSECCSPVSVFYKAPDCGGEPQSVSKKKGTTTISYANGKSVRVKLHDGRAKVQYRKGQKPVVKPAVQAAPISATGASVPVTVPAPPAE